MTAPTTPAGMPELPFAVFDEFGTSCDDRTSDYGRACYEAGRFAALEEAAAMVEQLTYRRRLLKRAVNGSQEVDGCEYAAAIRSRKGKTP